MHVRTLQTWSNIKYIFTYRTDQKFSHNKIGIKFWSVYIANYNKNTIYILNTNCHIRKEVRKVYETNFEFVI